MAVIADPKAVAARRNAGASHLNTAAVREQQLQAKKQRAAQAKAQAWRKEHGLA